MGEDTPQQTPEGSLIETAAKATGRSIKSLSANAGISDTRWRHIVRGWQPAHGGSQAPVTAPALTLARMAFAAGVTPDQLTDAGRTDAAELLARLDAAGDDSGIPLPAGGGYRSFNARASGGRMDSGSDEFAMIEASTSMSPQQKLEAIRVVLRLRAQVEALEAADQQAANAPAGQLQTNGEESTTSA